VPVTPLPPVATATLLLFPQVLARVLLSRCVHLGLGGLGGRHGGSATSCFCADPCTHSVQDLNRLLCFRHSQNHGIWWFHFLVSMKVKFFCDLELGRALPPTSVKGPTPLGKVGLCLVRLVHLNCV